MKSIAFFACLFISFVVFGQEFEFRSNLTKAEIEYKNTLKESWGESNKSAREAFKPVKKIIFEDAFTKKIFIEVEKKLQLMGINEVESAIEFCENRADGASGGFNENVRLVDYDFVAPGEKPEWKEETIKTIKEAYRIHILKVPFFEMLLIADKPSVCANKDESIRGAHDIFVHEFIHFLKSDSFKTYSTLITMDNVQEFIDFNLYSAGGEVEAYRVGVKAEIGLLKKIGITNPNLQYASFADKNGEIISEEGLRDYVKSLYLPYYEQYLPSYIYYTNQLNSSFIWYLKDAISKNKSSNPSWIANTEAELERLKSIDLR